MNRQEDLTKVFDRTWNANHNDSIQREKEREKTFIDKMFGVKKEKSYEKSDINTPNVQVQNQKRNIDGVQKFQRQIQTNSIIKKWK